MYQADHTHLGEIEFPPAMLGSGETLTEPTKQAPAGIAHSRGQLEIRVSGAQVLVALLSGLGSIGVLVWAIVRLWLFEG